MAGGGQQGKQQRKGKARNKQKKVAADGDKASALAQVRAVKSQANVLFSLAVASNPNPKHAGPFSDRSRILVIGDGDFSFSLSIATLLGGRKITATCFDSKLDLHEKYEDALDNAETLQSTGASTHFEVDGTALESQEWLTEADEKFDNIVFNFPHLGGATEEDVVKNQQLLRHFFFSTRSCLEPNRGLVFVSLRDTLFYNRWKIEEQASASGFQLQRKEQFDASAYPGYAPQRTHPASYRGDPPSTTGAHYYIFKLDKNATPSDPRTGTKATPAVAKPTKKRVKNKREKQDTTSYRCDVCDIAFPSEKKYNGHLNSAKHSRRVKRAKKKQ